MQLCYLRNCKSILNYSLLPLNHFELKLGNKNTGVGWMGQNNHTFTLFIGNHSVGWGILDSLFVKIQPDIVHIVQ